MKALKTKNTLLISLLISLGFVLLNTYFIAKENFYFLTLPLVALVIFYAIYSADKLLLFVVLFTPLTIPLSEFSPDLGIDMALPTEPIIVGLMLIFFFRILYKNDYDKNIFNHPLSFTIIFSLLWILVTTITSTIPVVSIKFFLSRLWFVTVFFYMTAILFKDFSNFKKYIWLYTLALLIVIAYTFSVHLSYGLFDQKAANFACNPFFKDHTAYGASLAMIFFPILGFAINKNSSITTRIIAAIVTIIILLALIFSYSRAAWLSIVTALGVLTLVLLKIKFKHLAFFTIIVSIIGLLIYNQLMDDLEKNKQDSSGNFEKHLQSMYNINTDASNVERINRWACALRMFQEKPVLGWGPGTYMFQYAPFQLSYQKTIISTNSGDRGNAHSEYLGPLAEQGVLGTLAFLLILIFSISTGLHAYKYAKNKEVRLFVLMILLGLITYFTHGFLNNFLDTDKLSVLFWGYIAFLTVSDIYFTQPANTKIKNLH